MKYEYIIEHDDARLFIIHVDGGSIQIRLRAVEIVEDKEYINKEHSDIIKLIDSDETLIEKYVTLVAENPDIFITADKIIL